MVEHSKWLRLLSHAHATAQLVHCFCACTSATWVLRMRAAATLCCSCSLLPHCRWVFADWVEVFFFCPRNYVLISVIPKMTWKGLWACTPRLDNPIVQRAKVKGQGSLPSLGVKQVVTWLDPLSIPGGAACPPLHQRILCMKDFSRGKLITLIRRVVLVTDTFLILC